MHVCWLWGRLWVQLASPWWLWQVCLAGSCVGVSKHQPADPQGSQRSVYATWSREASESPPTDLRVLVCTSNTSTQRDCSRAPPSVSVRARTPKLTWCHLWLSDGADLLTFSDAGRMLAFNSFPPEASSSFSAPPSARSSAGKALEAWPPWVKCWIKGPLSYSRSRLTSAPFCPSEPPVIQACQNLLAAPALH